MTDTLEKQTKAHRLLNQAKILRYKAMDLDEEISQLKEKLFILQSQRISFNTASSLLNAKAIALEKEFFVELDLVIRQTPPKPASLYDSVAAVFGKADADLIKGELESLRKETER